MLAVRNRSKTAVSLGHFILRYLRKEKIISHLVGGLVRDLVGNLVVGFRSAVLIGRAFGGVDLGCGTCLG